MNKILVLTLLLPIISCSTNSSKNDNLSSLNQKLENDSTIISSSISSISPDTTVNIDPSLTPYDGLLYYKASWKDSNGSNIFIISKRVSDKGEEGLAEIFAYQYLSKDNQWQLLWKTYDQVEGFGCDLIINTPKDLISVTDLDYNYIAETAYLYILDNRCDAVVVPTKMIIHIGNKKYAIRGFSQLKLGPSEEVMNRYLKEQGQKEVKYKETDPEMKKLDPRIQSYFNKIWDEFANREL